MGSPSVLKINVVSDSSRATKDIDAVGKSLDKTGNAARDAGRDLERTGKSTEELGDHFGETASKTAQVAGGFGDLGGALAQMHGPLGALGSGMEMLGPSIMGITGAADLAEVATTKLRLGTVKNTVATVASTAATMAQRAALAVATAAQWLFNAAMSANPIVLVTLAIVALVAAFVLAYQKVGWFRDAVNAMGRVVTGIFRAIVNAAQSVFGWISAHWPLLLIILTGPFGAVAVLIIRNWNTITAAFRSAYQTISGIVSSIIGVFSGIAGAISRAVSGLFGIITKPFNDAYTWIKAVWDGLASTVSIAFDGAMSVLRAIWNPFAGAWNAIHISLHAPGWLGGFGFTLDPPDLPTLASGGVFDRATLAIIGEGRGREIATPEALLRTVIRQESGGGATINVFVPEVANPAETGRAVANVLRAYFAAGGRLTVP